MNNPVQLTRDVIAEDIGDKKVSNNIDIEKELERLHILHKGWLDHPITLIVISRLQMMQNNKLLATFQNALINPSVPNPQATEAAVLSYVLNYLKTLKGI